MLHKCDNLHKSYRFAFWFCFARRTHRTHIYSSKVQQGMAALLGGLTKQTQGTESNTLLLNSSCYVHALTSHVWLLGHRLTIVSCPFLSISVPSMATHDQVSSCSFGAAACAARLYLCSRAMVACSGPQIRRRQCSRLSAGAAAPSPAWLCCKPQA